MDDISGVISQIMNDPERMQQIMELAQSLTSGEETQEPPLVSPERIEELGKMIRQTQHVDEKQEALVHALRPYLKPGRRSKLDRALQIAKLSHWAGIALKKENNT